MAARQGYPLLGILLLAMTTVSLMISRAGEMLLQGKPASVPTLTKPHPVPSGKNDAVPSSKTDAVPIATAVTPMAG